MNKSEVKLKVTEPLENDIFGKFKATYLNENETEVTAGGDGRSVSLKVNKGSEIVLNVECILDKITVGQTYVSEGVFNLYAKNPQQCAVFTVIKSPTISN